VDDAESPDETKFRLSGANPSTRQMGISPYDEVSKQAVLVTH